MTDYISPENVPTEVHSILAVEERDNHTMSLRIDCPARNGKHVITRDAYKAHRPRTKDYLVINKMNGMISIVRQTDASQLGTIGTDAPSLAAPAILPDAENTPPAISTAIESPPIPDENDVPDASEPSPAPVEEANTLKMSDDGESFLALSAVEEPSLSPSDSQSAPVDSLKQSRSSRRAPTASTGQSKSSGMTTENNDLCPSPDSRTTDDQ